MARPLHYPKTVGARLSKEDSEKLERLCTATQRTPGEVLRLLVRLAQTTDLPPVQFAAPRAHEAGHA